ncbi:M23 family metallopeptidase [Qipengyuania aquimaris]|nr:M23 family metallopeptidase [Qipengyuania aquimaris]
MSWRRVAPLFLIAGLALATPQAFVVSASEADPAEPAARIEPLPTAPILGMPAPPPPPAELDGELEQGGWIRGVLPPGAVSATFGGEPIAVDNRRREFFIGLDRDTARSAELVLEGSDGQTRKQTLSIAPRDWQIERVNVAKGTGGGSEAWWKKREPEWLAIRDARAKETGAEGWRQDFIWPVTGRISGRFGRQRIYRGEPGSYHSGIDIAPGNGVPFVAPADGTVVLARTGFSLEGGIIIIDHGAGLNSAFIHLSRLSVSEGDKVEQGQLLGNVGASGRATGPHLHWSLMWRDARLDPLLFLPPMP